MKRTFLSVCRITPSPHWALTLGVLVCCTTLTHAQHLAAAPGVTLSNQPLTIDGAVRFSLENNPQLTALRLQHGIAAGAVVIARTYPYNPALESRLTYADGPPSAGVTNHVPNQQFLSLPLEVLGQGKYRRDAAFAALSRTDLEIAAQELTFAINTVRAYDTLFYRQAKLRLTLEFLDLNQKAADQVKKLVSNGTLKAADLILARTEVIDIEAQIGLQRIAVLSARKDLSRALGVADNEWTLQGTLERPAPAAMADQLLPLALRQRPDLLARQSAVAEAAARVKLQVADRFGNPTVGVVYEKNESQTQFVGPQIGLPIPVFNRHAGEIAQLKAQEAQAAWFLRQTEVEIEQDVISAVLRVAEAHTWVDKYQNEIIRDLKKSLADLDKLFIQGQPGVDVLRLIDVRRKLLRANDGYLDAALTYAQALADLAFAIGDPALAIGCYPQYTEPSAVAPHKE